MLRNALLFFFVCCCVSNVHAAGDTFSVFFRTAESTLTEGTMQQIDDAIYNGALSDRTGIELIGYADEVGGDSPNLQLSKARAAAVKAYLVQSGFRSERITLIIGKGKKEARTNTGGEGYPRDRRVDIVKVSLPVQSAEPQSLQTPPPPVSPPMAISQALSTAMAGESIKLDKIFFQPGRNVFTPGATDALDQLYEGLMQNPALRIKIEGHVCCTNGLPDGLDEGTGKYNLSVTRALAVRNYLIKKGIMQERLQYEGMGRRKPVFPQEQTEAEAQANRRVEIIVLPN